MNQKKANSYADTAAFVVLFGVITVMSILLARLADLHLVLSIVIASATGVVAAAVTHAVLGRREAGRGSGG